MKKTDAKASVFLLFESINYKIKVEFELLKLWLQKTSF